jgi:hypothetical protein
LLVVLAAHRLHTSGGGYGLLLAAVAAGAFTGPILLTRLPARMSRPTIVFEAFGLRGLVDLVLATVTVPAKGFTTVTDPRDGTHTVGGPAQSATVTGPP